MATKEDTKDGEKEISNDERVQQIEQEREEAYLMSEMQEELNYGELLSDNLS